VDLRSARSFPLFCYTPAFSQLYLIIHRITAGFMFYFLQLGCLLGDSNPDVWTGLSDGLKSYLSKSVASIAVFNGDYICLALSVF
jgi:succinate dehydrogenase/fumarate reductase cytochrome b subunit